MNNAIPAYAQRKSKGPLFKALLPKLNAFASKKGLASAQGDKLDDDYADLVGAIQAMFGLDPDGNLGPKTRECFERELGIDFSALEIEPGLTTFVQPDGVLPLYWAPGMEASADLRVARERYQDAVQ